MTLLFFCLIIGALIITGIAIHKWAHKRDAKKAQARQDEIIESALDELSQINIELLAKHSDKEAIARKVSTRIYDCLKLAVHPDKLVQIFENLGLFIATRNGWSTKEIELAALIQQYVMRCIDSHDLDVWNIEVCRDKKRGYEGLNKSFLVKVDKNMLIWSPLSN